MDDYIGLDRSMKETAVSIRRGGKRVWRGKCPSDPELIADLIRKRAPSVKRVVFETGPLSVWSYLTRSTGIAPCQMVDLIHRLCWLSILALLDSSPHFAVNFFCAKDSHDDVINLRSSGAFCSRSARPAHLHCKGVGGVLRFAR